MDAERIERSLMRLLSERSEGVVAAYLFGSLARGTATEKSDVDVAVLYRETPRAALDSAPLRLESDLERLLGRPVQVVALNSAPVDLAKRVLGDGKLLFEGDRSARIRFEVDARNRFFDLEPVLRLYRKTERAAS